MMNKKKSTIKRMVLTGAAATVLVVGLAAPAMALPPGHDVPTDLPPITVEPPDPPDPPFCVKHPVICGRLDDLPVLTVDPPDDPPANPPTNPPANPPADPPANPNPPANTNGGGGSNAGSSVGGSYGTESVNGTFDRGGVFLSELLPNTFTSTLSDTGNSVKKNLPASVSKSLPNTGSGWSLLLLAAGALVAGGVVLRKIAKRRTTNVTPS